MIINTAIGLDPNKRVIKRLWCIFSYILYWRERLKEVRLDEVCSVIETTGAAGKRKRFESSHEKTCFLHVRKQKRRSERERVLSM